MARTFIDQPTQVFHSDTYNDQFATGVQLVSSSTSLEDDLNALRTQVRQALWAGVTGNWYDGVQGVAGGNPARGINTLNSALNNLERTRLIYTVRNLAQVVVPSGSNFVSLSVSGTTAPAGLAAVGFGAATGSFTGTIVATLFNSPTGNGQPGSAHSLNLVSGSSGTIPRNMVSIRDAFTYGKFTDSLRGGHEIKGLLQIESGALDSQAFSDTAPGRTQISFVVEYPSGTWVAASTAAIGGKIVSYQYRVRSTYSGLPEDAFVNTTFLDSPVGASSSSIQLSDITLQQAINTQANTVVNENGFNTAIDLAGGGLGTWTFLSSSQILWKLLASTNTFLISASNFAVSSSNPAAFLRGIQVATGTAEIDIGIAVGTIATKFGQNLVLSGGANLTLSDQYGPTSTFTGGAVPLAASGAEWNNFFSGFGASSILGAFNTLSSSFSGSVTPKRLRLSAGVTAAVTSNTNVTFPTNLDAALPSYLGRDFLKDVNVFLNGILVIPGRTVSDPCDVYPGTSPSTADLKFTMPLRSGTIISLERF